MQYSGGYAVRRKHTISTDAGVQYGSNTPLVRKRRTGVCVQYSGGYLVRVCHTISAEEARLLFLFWVCSSEEAHHQYG